MITIIKIKGGTINHQIEIVKSLVRDSTCFAFANIHDFKINMHKARGKKFVAIGNLESLKEAERLVKKNDHLFGYKEVLDSGFVSYSSTVILVKEEEC